MFKINYKKFKLTTGIVDRTFIFEVVFFDSAYFYEKHFPKRAQCLYCKSKYDTVDETVKLRICDDCHDTFIDHWKPIARKNIDE